MSTRSRGVLRTLLASALAAALTGGSLTVSAPAFASAPAKLSFSGISFATDRVDVTTGATTVALNWAVADTSSAATQVKGTVFVQQYNGADAVGPAMTIRYALNPAWPVDVFASPGSTTRNATYSYQFLVRQYGASTNPTWKVTRITATDDQGTAKELDGNLAGLRVTGLADTSAPTISWFGRNFGQRDIVFDNGSGLTLRYALDVTDPETGFWKGYIALKGPGHANVISQIRLVDVGDFWPHCGQTAAFDLTDVWCDLEVKLPAGSPSGTWSVSAIELTNTAGVSRRYTGVSPEPIRVTRNDTLSASGFGLSPSLVDNWREARVVTLSMLPSNVHDGLASILVESDGCFASTEVPVIGSDGTASIPLLMTTFSSACAVTGIALIDGAGHVAAYGSGYGAPALTVTATRIPDTTPPVALAASLSETTRLHSATNYISLHVTVDDTTLAPINAFSVTFYDVNGVSVGGGDGGVKTGPDGMVRLLASVGSLPVGTYTAGFMLYDAAGNYAQYGYPNGVGNPAPSGPLVLTVIDG